MFILEVLHKMTMRYSFVSTRFTFIQETFDVTLAWDDDKRIQARKCKKKDTLDITLAWDDEKRIEARKRKSKDK